MIINQMIVKMKNIDMNHLYRMKKPNLNETELIVNIMRVSRSIEAFDRIKPCQNYKVCKTVEFDGKYVYYPYMTKNELKLFSSSTCSRCKNKFLEELRS